MAENLHVETAEARPARRRSVAVVASAVDVAVRMLRDHSIPLALLLAVAMVGNAVLHVDRALGVAGNHHLRQDTGLASLAAQEVVVQMARDGRREDRRVMTSWGAPVRIEHGLGETFRLLVTRGGNTMVFPGEWLPGAAPACFGQALTVGCGDAGGAKLDWLPQAHRVRLGPQPQLALPAGPLARLPEVVCDGELALLHVRSGTDRVDWVWGRDVEAWSLRGGEDLLEVPGNLWVPPSPRPLQVNLARPLTVVVRGNIYLGRDLEVTGQGPLTLVAVRQGKSFRDLDADGVCGADEPLLPGHGPQQLEGDGSVYLGLPGGRGAQPLRCAAQLVATGEVHVLVSVRLAAALVSYHGVTRCQPTAELTLAPDPLLDVERARVPGFAVTGGPRPARLRPSFVLPR